MSNLSVLLVLLTACTSVPAKFYMLDSQKGLVRKQASETVPFDKANGYLCASPRDAEFFLNKCVQAKRQCE